MSEDKDREQYGVLLYYNYAEIPDLNHLLTFYNSNCSSLNLRGRVRLSTHGVNVTVGGNLSSLESHIEALKAYNSLFHRTDFKLATCHHPLNDKVARECGFTSLSIRIVDELVTLSSHPLLKAPDISNAGMHLSALDFHSSLHNAYKESPENGLVLLDARNLYETRIGKFHVPNVETLDPQVRQYSDLSSWIDDNGDRLKGKNIFMYCTGGIRCEMASAYIKSKGAGFENVFQLFGGIQRYLEQFPDGGFFKGKNFVFDHRISVGSSDANIIGTCLMCQCSFDDYTSRCRCTYCRMLVLVCRSCESESTVYVCELCQKQGKPESAQLIEIGESKTSSSDAEFNNFSSDLPRVPRGDDPRTSRKLRILCLHGFRQNASSFKGRTASLAKKLKKITEFVFVDAPHELPFIYQTPMFESNENCASSSLPSSPPPPLENCKKKFAWFVAPNFDGSSGVDWKVADGPFDPLQYQQQTVGYDISLSHLKNVFSQEGPFDGILGFSQGAAMAALISALQEELKGEMDFKFVVLCSGFALRMKAMERGPIKCPSLHIFGNEHGKDRQIANQTSKELASLYEGDCSAIVEHDNGHIIPTRSPYIDEIKNFLNRFL
ncbi:rhodanese-like domain-containing protein 6 [Vigna radiata var. radiata]|uniref:Rhodanese-like domain-containing protein 6 n=1 Tax=Vigna radiata var. radiata TaxID=3916 RepID=A0A1S3V1V2_VIGRR|nr:rhodanese-like domain-containing protein 6 [Vigna radiata var. radiata]